MNEDWVERDASVVWHGFTQMSSFSEASPIVVERADGHELIDADGNRYLDAISSLWVSTLGHRVPELDQALRGQLEKVAHSTLLGNTNTAVVELAEALAGVVPVDEPHFLFASDGASAVEQALKIAFQYWWNIGESQRTSYVALGSSYHGDTMGALSLGDGGFGTSLFDPLRFPVVRAPGYEDPASLRAAARIVRERRDELAAIVMEPLVQGAAGMLMADPAGYGDLRDACRESGVLLICDEVATGFGRTGSLFASDRCGLRPDILCLGKGMTGGYLPMSATAVNRRVYEAFLGADLGPKTLYHGHSYGGNALAAAVARRHLELIEEKDILSNVRARSRELGNALERDIAPLPGVADVRLCGLMGGVDLVAPEAGTRLGRRVCAESTARGVLLRPLGDTIVLMPPLSVTSAEIERIVATLRASIAHVLGATPVAATAP